MTKAKAFLLTSMLMVTGCSFIPRYQRPEAPVPPAYPGAGMTNTASATIPWNQFFTDARQQHLIALALTNNRDLRAAALRVDQSQAQYRISRSALFPRETATSGFDRTRSGGITRDQWSASLGTTAYEVDLFGRVRSLNRQALEKFFATKEARRATQVSLVAEVATADLDLRRATQQLALAAETLRLVEESRTLNQAALDAGASNELDVRSADAQVEFTRVSLLEAQLQLAEARNRLEFLLGQALPAELASAPLPLNDTLLARVPAGLPSALIQSRPDILQAEHTLRAANANIGAARASFLPTLRLTTSTGTTSDELSKLFGAGTGVWSFSPQLTLPIFTGGENRANLAAARITVRIEIANYEKAIQAAFREVADALAAIEARDAQATAFGSLTVAQQRRFDLAQARYRQGEDIYLNVLVAQQDLFDARQRAIDNTFSRLSSRIVLFKGLGGGWN
jgi:outer membrane protein, multidrug efflux system